MSKKTCGNDKTNVLPKNIPPARQANYMFGDFFNEKIVSISIRNNIDECNSVEPYFEEFNGTCTQMTQFETVSSDFVLSIIKSSPISH